MNFFTPLHRGRVITCTTTFVSTSIFALLGLSIFGDRPVSGDFPQFQEVAPALPLTLLVASILVTHWQTAYCRNERLFMGHLYALAKAHWSRQSVGYRPFSYKNFPHLRM